MSDTPNRRALVIGDPVRLQEPARIARNASELVLLDLARIPIAFDREGVAERLRRAIGDCNVALDVRAEEPAFGDALEQAIARLGEAHEMLLRAQDGTPVALMVLERPLTVLADATVLLRRRADEAAELRIGQLMDSTRWRFASSDGDTKSAPSPFRASIGLPRLHVVRRDPMHAFVPLGTAADPPMRAAPAPVLAKPRTLEQLQAFADAATSGALAQSLEREESDEEPPPEQPILRLYRPAVEEQEALRTLARDILEDIGSLGNLRKPIVTETWLDQAPFEQRLLDNLDYFVSLGPAVLPMVTIYHRESESPDLHRAFALAFTLGCIDGRDTAGTVIMSLKTSAKEEWPAFVEGLALAPNPAIEELCTELLLHADPGIAGVALDVLSARGSLPLDVVEWIRARNDRELLLKLARGLSANLERDVAITALDAIAWEAADDEIWLEAMRSSLRRGHGHARDRIRDTMRAPPSAVRLDGAATLLAIAGHPDDLDAILWAMSAAPSIGLLRAVGRFGHVGTLRPLVEILSRGDELAEAAGEALDRITGAGLRLVEEEPWDIGLPPEMVEPAEKIGAPKPMRKVDKVNLDPAVWEEWTKKNLPSLDMRSKHRGGQLFRPLHIVDELESKSTPTSRRDEAAFELGCALSAMPRFRSTDWVALQKTQLAELRSLAARSDDSPGTWLFAGHPTRPTAQPIQGSVGGWRAT